MLTPSTLKSNPSSVASSRLARRALRRKRVVAIRKRARRSTKALARRTSPRAPASRSTATERLASRLIELLGTRGQGVGTRSPHHPIQRPRRVRCLLTVRRLALVSVTGLSTGPATRVFPRVARPRSTRRRRRDRKPRGAPLLRTRPYEGGRRPCPRPPPERLATTWPRP